MKDPNDCPYFSLEGVHLLRFHPLSFGNHTYQCRVCGSTQDGYFELQMVFKNDEPLIKSEQFIPLTEPKRNYIGLINPTITAIGWANLYGAKRDKGETA